MIHSVVGRTIGGCRVGRRMFVVRLIGGLPTGPRRPSRSTNCLPRYSCSRANLDRDWGRRGADGEETGTLKAALKEARGQLLYSPCSGSRLPCCQGGRVVVACSAPRNDKTISQNGRPCELKRDKARFSPRLFRRMVPNSPTSDLVRTRRPGGGTSPGSSGSGPVDQHGTKIEPTSHSALYPPHLVCALGGARRATTYVVGM